jgi:hypothetical protein
LARAPNRSWFIAAAIHGIRGDHSGYLDRLLDPEGDERRFAILRLPDDEDDDLDDDDRGGVLF